MIRLTREFRFSLAHSGSDLNRIGNSWSGWYSSNRIAPYLKFQLTVSGSIQKPTGYLCNVKLLDGVIREFVESRIQLGSLDWTYEQFVCDAIDPLQSSLPKTVSLESIALIVSPTMSYFVEQEKAEMVSMTQQFEFSAAHRLHCDELSADENREIFGKCNNPEGHGHNYVVEITVTNQVRTPQGQVANLGILEQTVKTRVIDRLDHKHLNRDVAEFAQLNPSVENIAVQIWDWLDGQIEGTHLKQVRVYETPKTWADYCGPSSD